MQSRWVIQLKITDSVRDYLAESGFDSKYGARPLKEPFRINWKIRWPIKFLKAEFELEIQ